MRRCGLHGKQLTSLSAQPDHVPACCCTCLTLHAFCKLFLGCKACVHCSLIWSRLLALQARKLAVELCDVLFSRSKCFRRVLAGQFSQFVELGVGHKPDKPLPPPAAAAAALRERSLEVIERWHEAWGLHYPQVCKLRFIKCAAVIVTALHPFTVVHQRLAMHGC